ncbi:hypothetical protein C0J08_14735 [Marinomonas sp. CT5]|uniref:hypothetical protein n=1 Tax=Marinomonas sp. CT5 TaxID=2066133 RepID=UPI001BB03702|nr:hypothetical protein [Marinomonas sp. CT5]QUX96577.1 hypothetical protein C0J08_14735 [Marinomonas sp. CT5]
MSNNLQDLNSYLFSQLERLNNPELKGDELKDEIERSKAVTNVSKGVVENATLQLEAVKLRVEYVGLNNNQTLQGLIGNGK